MSEFFGPPLCQRCDGTALIIGDDGEPRDCPSCINGREPVPGLDALRARVERLKKELRGYAISAHAGFCLGNFDECTSIRCVAARATLEGK